MNKPTAACSAAVILLFTLSLGCNPCTTTQRELRVSNNSSQPIWVGGGGGALRAVCVVNATNNCLTGKLNNPLPGQCMCGSTLGKLACPGTSVPTADGKNCACSAGMTCGPTAGCNAATKLCYFVLPNATELTGFVPSEPWNWELPAGGTAEFCLDPASATWKSGPSAAPTQVPAAVWWSGGVFARTGCRSDGTNCLAGDCSAAPNANCSAGVGGNNPATIAEFTLQRQATDFYDITVINGANIAEQMGPIPTPTMAPPAGFAKSYWCKIPGSGCNWNFGKYVAAVPLAPTPAATPAASRIGAGAASATDYTSLLMFTTQQCSTASGGAKCPSGFTCSGAPGACFKACGAAADCPKNLRCLPAGNGVKYCQCQQESDCSQQPDHQFCGTQFIPGLGPNQVFLQQCGDFGGWWSGDDFCGNPNNTVGPFDCGKAVTDGDGKLTNIASLFGCNGAGGGNPANQASCYNAGANPTAGCCGCATYNGVPPIGKQSANPLAPLWPTATGNCASNNPVWAARIQPWLANLKQACPDAYSYPFDDFTSTFQCQATGATNLLGYAITFADLVQPSPAPTPMRTPVP